MKLQLCAFKNTLFIVLYGRTFASCYETKDQAVVMVFALRHVTKAQFLLLFFRDAHVLFKYAYKERLKE